MEGLLIKHCRYPAIHGAGWLAGPWSYDCARPAPPVGWPLQSNGSEACGLTASSGRTNQSHTSNVSKISTSLHVERGTRLCRANPSQEVPFRPVDLMDTTYGCSRDILARLAWKLSVTPAQLWRFHVPQRVDLNKSFPPRTRNPYCRSVRAKKKKVIKNRRKKIINFDTLIDGNRNNPSNC